MRERMRIELIYVWEKYKDDLEYLGMVLLAPLWLPLVFMMLLFAPDNEADERWCKEHNREYPSYAGWDAPRIVKKWKKEYKQRERLERKERIRQRLELEKKIKEGFYEKK